MTLSALVAACVIAVDCNWQIGYTGDAKTCFNNGGPCGEKLIYPPLSYCYQQTNWTGYYKCDPGSNYMVNVYWFDGGTCDAPTCKDANHFLGATTNSVQGYVLLSCSGSIGGN